MYFISCFLLISQLQLSNQLNGNDFFDDWSAFNQSQKSDTRAGLLLQLTDKGLNEFEKIILAQLRSALADRKYVDNGVRGNEIEIRVGLRFIKDRGIGAKVFLPRGFLDANDTARAQTALPIQFLITLRKDTAGNLIADVPYCEEKLNGNAASVEASASSRQSDGCQRVRNLIGCSKTSPDYGHCPQLSSPVSCLFTGAGWSWNSSGLMEAAVRQATSAIQYQQLLDYLTRFPIDQRLAANPSIESDFITIPLRGGSLLESPNTTFTPINPLAINRQSQTMFRAVVTEHLWNTLFNEVFQRDLIKFKDKFSMDALPPVVRYPLQSMCWSCQLQVELSLLSAPVMTIQSDGAKIKAAFSLRMLASGFMYDASIMNGQAEVNASLGVRVVNGSLEGNLAMENAVVDPGKTGLASYMPVTFSASLSQWVKQRAWPPLNAIAQAAFSALDISQMCEFKFKDVHLTCIKGGLVFNAGFSYNP